jgi:hypothetical protein
MTGRALACQAKRKAVGVTVKDNQREELLAAALRENLRRRKAQARKVREDKPDPTD